jgi:glutamate--cysteine ligase
MDAERLRPRVARLFAPRSPLSARVAIEHELLTVDVRSGASAPIDVIRQVVGAVSCATHLGFEPGGQVELSLPCAASPAALARRLGAEVAMLRAACGAGGVRIVASPVDTRAEDRVPLQLRTARYVAMQRHFDAIGPAGRRMMRRTAATQICLDWWPGRAGYEQWQVLNLAGPRLAAALAAAPAPMVD